MNSKHPVVRRLLIAMLAASGIALVSPPPRAVADPVNAPANATSTTHRPEHLWISREQWHLRRQALLDSPLRQLADDANRVLHETSGVSIEGAGNASADFRTQAQLRLKALTVRAACFDDVAAADEAARWIECMLAEAGRSDLGRASAALHCVVAYAFCHPLWDSPERRRIEQALQRYGLAFQNIGEGNPDNPFNNWWAVTHSAAGLCLLAAEGSNQAPATALRQEIEAVASYLLNYGDAGHYYEGTGYGLYSSAFWMPFRLAVLEAKGVDLAHHANGALQMPVSVCAITVAGCNEDPALEDARRELRPFWNDDGGGFVAADLASLFCATNPASANAIHATLHQVYSGRSAESLYRIEFGHGHPMWTLLYYPLDQPKLTYGEGLPLRWIDQRTGLAVLRNRYRDGQDIVFAAYAKAYHGGGHTHHDAGSFRLVGLGNSWAHAGGQAKPDPQYQNVLLHNRPTSETEIDAKNALGKIVYFAEHAGGGNVSLDVSEVYGVGRLRRHFAIAYDPLPGVDAIVALYDEVVDREGQPSDWTWSLCYDNPLQPSIEAKRNAFELCRPKQEANLRASFDPIRPLAIEMHEGPSSERTFSEGGRKLYPGAKYLTANGDGDESDFFVVMTLQRGNPPTVRFEGKPEDRRAFVGEGVKIRLERSKWFQGPLRIEQQQ